MDVTADGDVLFGAVVPASGIGLLLRLETATGVHATTSYSLARGEDGAAGIVVGPDGGGLLMPLRTKLQPKRLPLRRFSPTGGVWEISTPASDGLLGDESLIRRSADRSAFIVLDRTEGAEKLFRYDTTTERFEAATNLAAPGDWLAVDRDGSSIVRERHCLRPLDGCPTPEAKRRHGLRTRP